MAFKDLDEELSTLGYGNLWSRTADRSYDKGINRLQYHRTRWAEDAKFRTDRKAYWRELWANGLGARVNAKKRAKRAETKALKARQDLEAQASQLARYRSEAWA